MTLAKNCTRIFHNSQSVIHLHFGFFIAKESRGGGTLRLFSFLLS
nr:MAG TPA: hypothetical protein [Caudoviricetes sp.]